MCHVVSLREALSADASAAGFALHYAPGLLDPLSNDTSGFAAATAAAATADAVVLAVGATTCADPAACNEGESNDRVTNAGGGEGLLGFSGAQLALIQAVAAARRPGVPLVVVQFHGGPISSPATVAAADSVLVAWFPGYEGGAALADVLLGRASPTGRLPVTMLPDASQLPLFSDTVLTSPPGRTYTHYTGTPLFPFGFGLTYASVTYAGMAVAPRALAPTDAAFVVSAQVTRPAGGAFTGPLDEVVQLYGSYTGVNATGGATAVPRTQLLAFTRVRGLLPGGQASVTLTVPRRALALVQPAGGAPAVSAGNWTLTVGGGPPSNAEYAGGSAVLTSWLQVLV